MSLQRVLDFARRQTLPVVVTDVAGREPLVVLPLEVYEKLVEAHFPPSASSANDVARPHAPASSDTLRVRQRDQDRVSALHQSLEAVSAAPTGPPTHQSTPSPSLSLEERFVFQS